MATIHYGVKPDIFEREAQKKAKNQYGVKPDIFKYANPPKANGNVATGHVVSGMVVWSSCSKHLLKELLRSDTRVASGCNMRRKQFGLGTAPNRSNSQAL